MSHQALETESKVVKGHFLLGILIKNDGQICEVIVIGTTSIGKLDGKPNKT